MPRLVALRVLVWSVSLTTAWGCAYKEITTGGDCTGKGFYPTQSVFHCLQAAKANGHDTKDKVSEIDSIQGGIPYPQGCFYDEKKGTLIVNHGTTNYADCTSPNTCYCITWACIDTVAPPTALPTVAPPTSAPPTPAPPPPTPAPPTPHPPTEAPPTAMPTAVPTASPPTPSPPTLVPTAVPTGVPPTPAPPTLAPTPAPPTSAPATPVPPTPVPLVSATVAWVDPPAELPSSAFGRDAGVQVRFVLANGGKVNTSFFTQVRNGGVDWGASVLDVLDVTTDNDKLVSGMAWALREGKLRMLRAPVVGADAQGDTMVSFIMRIPGYRADMQETVAMSLRPQALGRYTRVQDSSESVQVLVRPAQQDVVARSMVDTVSALPAGQQIALLLDLECGNGSRDGLPLLMHPTGVFISDSNCLGAVVFNSLIFWGLLGGQYIVSFIVLRVVQRYPVIAPTFWLPIRLARSAQGLVRFPGGALILFMFFFQGQAKCTFVLVFDGISEASAVKLLAAALSLFILLAVPVHIAVTLRNAAKANLMRYRVTSGSGMTTFFAGPGEWVSKYRRDPVTFRYSMQLRTFAQGCAHYLLYDFILMMFVGFGTALPAMSYAACGHIRVFLAVVCLGFVVLEVRRRPHARQRDNVADIARLVLQCIGLILAGVGYYLEDLTHPVIMVAAIMFFIALLILMVQLVCDVCTELYIFWNGRRNRLQEAEWAEHDTLYEEETPLHKDQDVPLEVTVPPPSSPGASDEESSKNTPKGEPLGDDASTRPLPPSRFNPPAYGVYSTPDAVRAVRDMLETDPTTTAPDLAKRDDRLPEGDDEAGDLLRMARGDEMLPNDSIARIRKMLENPNAATTPQSIRRDDPKHPRDDDTLRHYIAVAKTPTGRFYTPEESVDRLCQLIREDPTLTTEGLRDSDPCLPQGSALQKLVDAAETRINGGAVYTEDEAVDRIRQLCEGRREPLSHEELRKVDPRFPRNDEKLDVLVCLAMHGKRPYTEQEALKIVKWTMAGSQDTWTLESIRDSDKRLPQRAAPLRRLLKIAESNGEIYDEAKALSVVHGMMLENPLAKAQELCDADPSLPQDVDEVRRLMRQAERDSGSAEGSPRPPRRRNFNFQRNRTWTGLLADVSSGDQAAIRAPLLSTSTAHDEASLTDCDSLLTVSQQNSPSASGGGWVEGAPQDGGNASATSNPLLKGSFVSAHSSNSGSPGSPMSPPARRRRPPRLPSIASLNASLVGPPSRRAGSHLTSLAGTPPHSGGGVGYPRTSGGEELQSFVSDGKGNFYETEDSEMERQGRRLAFLQVKSPDVGAGRDQRFPSVNSGGSTPSVGAVSAPRIPTPPRSRGGSAKSPN